MYSVAPTTSAREIRNADHRIRLLERALRDERKGKRATMNKVELVKLSDMRDGWRGEPERNHAAWIEHHRRQRRTLIELAQWHHVALTRLIALEIRETMLRETARAGVHRFENPGGVSGDAA